MICRNCGKEIPDNAKYCGYCGAEQIVEEKAVDVKEEPVSSDKETAEVKKDVFAKDEEASESNQDTAKEEKTVETVESGEKKEVSTTEPESSEKKADDVITEEKKETNAVETQSTGQKSSEEAGKEENNLEGSKVVNETPVAEERPAEKNEENNSAEKEKKSEIRKEKTKEKLKDAGSKIADTAEPVINKGKKAVHKADWNSFGVYLDILKHPFENHKVGSLPLWTGIVIMILGSWFVFGSFGNGLFVLLFALAGSVFVQYIASKGKEDFHITDAFENAFCSIFIPFIACFIAGVFYHSGSGDVTTIARRLGLIIVLMIFAAVMYGTSIAKSAEKTDAWLLVLVLTVVYSAAVYYLLSQSLTQITAFFGTF